VRVSYCCWRQRFLKYLQTHSFVLRFPIYVIVHGFFLLLVTEDFIILLFGLSFGGKIFESLALQSLVAFSHSLFLISIFKLYVLFSIFAPAHVRTNGARLCATSNNLCYVITDKGNVYIPRSPLLDPRNIVRKCNSLV
jgi:hypothetical protein